MATFGAPGLARTRTVLERKRVDDAMPLLAFLGRHSAKLRPIAERAIARHERPFQLAAPADAFHIASEARADASLAEAADMDLLLLRARFQGPDPKGVVTPRTGPWVGSVVSAKGRLWAAKGLGTQSPIHIYQRAPR